MNCIIFYGSYLNEEHAKLFGKDAEQSAFSEKEGRVKVHFLENDLKEIYYQDCTEKKCNKICKSALIMVLNLATSPFFAEEIMIFSIFSKLLGNLKTNYKGRRNLH